MNAPLRVVVSSAECACGCGEIVASGKTYRKGHHWRVPGMHEVKGFFRTPPSFESQYRVAESGCWEWTGLLMTPGYGSYRFRGRATGAHRVAYEKAFGPIEKGLFVCHSCDNRKCVNPSHLFLGTCGDNLRDMHRKGRWIGRSSLATECPRGHPYAGDNLKIVVQANGKPARACRVCNRAKANNYRARNLEKCRARDRKLALARYYRKKEAACQQAI